MLIVFQLSRKIVFCGNVFSPFFPARSTILQCHLVREEREEMVSLKSMTFLSKNHNDIFKSYVKVVKLNFDDRFQKKRGRFIYTVA